MPLIYLSPEQLDAAKQLHNGCVLCGGVGTGKSRTALAYYYLQNGGDLEAKTYVKMTDPCDLYIITTAKKRDSRDWESEMIPFFLMTDEYQNHVVIDSWNNIGRYRDVCNAFFIFDEQRASGKGVWAKTFIRIARRNQWILLSATPGDKWLDYAPIFIANGFYKNRSDFNEQHVIWRCCNNRWMESDEYMNTGRLLRLRDKILVDIEYLRRTKKHILNVDVDYDVKLYKEVMRNRFDYVAGKPIENAVGLCLALRKIVNTDISRWDALLKILDEHPRAIIYYSYDFELDILLGLNYAEGTKVAQWNGHKHQDVPDGEKWVYLVQYTSGAEGWNCTTTDTIIFYSQQYSYKVLEQCMGRIDRRNTPFTDLYYYTLVSRSSIDVAIALALKRKKKFNESAFLRSKKEKG